MDISNKDKNNTKNYIETLKDNPNSKCSTTNSLPLSVKSTKPKKLVLLRSVRCFIFFLFFINQIFMSIYSGDFSASSKLLQRITRLNDSQFNIFRTSTVIARIFGSILFIILTRKLSRKVIFLFYGIFKGICLISIKISNISQIILIPISLINIIDMIPTIFFPIWINQYGFCQYKNAMMACIQLAHFGGSCIGNLVFEYLDQDKQQIGLYLLEVSFIIFLIFVFISTNENYLSQTILHKKITTYKKALHSAKDRKESVFEDLINDDLLPKVEEKSQIEKKNIFLRELETLVKNKIFLLGIVSLGLSLGINNVLQFWLLDYLSQVIKIKAQTILIFVYSIVFILGSSLGILFNLIFNQIIGNYDSRKASFSLLIFYLFSCLFGVNLAFTKTLVPFIFIALAYISFSSCSLTFLQGIVISCINTDLSCTGFSLANALTQLFMSHPIVMLYGIINEKYKQKSARTAMICLMFVLVLNLPFIIALVYVRNKELTSLNNKFKDKKKVPKNFISYQNSLSSTKLIDINMISGEISNEQNFGKSRSTKKLFVYHSSNSHPMTNSTEEQELDDTIHIKEENDADNEESDHI